MKAKKKVLIGIASLFGLLLVCALFPNQETTLVHQIKINAPKDQVYNTLSQIDNVDEWVDAVLSAEYVSGISHGAGATRECKLSDGSVVQETVTKAVDNQFIEMEMVQHNLPVDFFVWKIETIADNNATLVRQTTRYQVKFGLIGVLLNRMAVKSSLDHTLKGAYEGLKPYIEKRL